MDMGINGKVALVTASGRGLGFAIAKNLANEGVRLILNSRTNSDLVNLKKNLDSNGKEHIIYCGDLTLPDEPKKLITFLNEIQVFPDIVVHNLGGNLNKNDPLGLLSDWKSVMRVNVEVTVELNRELIPYMQRKKWGRICNVSSISALENQGPPSYCAAKAALIAYARSLSRYVAKDGVVINSVLPGAVFTEGGYWDDASKNRPDHVESYLKERMAIQRFGTPEEISGIVTFLCSNHASFCVGSSFLADGGQGKVFYSQG
jgi:3-oxoacyl-[acyl-carrier protein] reductase